MIFQTTRKFDTAYARLILGKVGVYVLTGSRHETGVTTMFIIFWDILIDEQIFFSPQVNRSVIISIKHGIYELPHEFLNDLRLRILGN